jgi:hypothetical protein
MPLPPFFDSNNCESWSSARSISGVPFTSTMHFVLLLVYSPRRLPMPAARIMACIYREF